MKIGFKKFIPLFLVSVICAVFLRVMQITQMTEPNNGFFYRGYESIGNIVTIGIFVIAAICVIYAALCKKSDINPIVITKPFAIIHFVMAAAILYETFASTFGGTIYAWQALFQMVFGLIAAIIFAYRGYAAFTGTEVNPMLSVSYLLFWLIRVIIVFSSSIAVPSVAENIFEMAALCTALIFFLNSSSFENEVNAERTAKRILPSAVAAVVMGAVYSVSQLWVVIIGKESLLHAQKATFFTNGVLIVYILYYVVLCFKNKAEETVTETAEDENKEIIE